jgi:hypothetical protein
MKDLVQRVARLFSPKPYEHRWKHGECLCGANVNFDVPDLRPCTIPDPIDITDLGKALEMFRKVTEHFPHKKISEYILKVMSDKLYHEISSPEHYCAALVLYEATAEQIWEICILAKESNNV